MGEVRESSVHPLSVSILRKAFGEIAAEMSHLVLDFFFFFRGCSRSLLFMGSGLFPERLGIFPVSKYIWVPKSREVPVAGAMGAEVEAVVTSRGMGA